MHLQKFLLCTTALACSVGPASADPVSIGSLIISAALSVGAGGLLPAASAAFIGGSVLFGAATLAANVAASIFLRPSTKTDPQKVKNTEQGSEGPGRYLVGRAIAGGKLAFGNTSGYKIYRMPLHAFGPLDFAEEYYYGGRIVIIDAVTGECSSPPYLRSTGTVRLNVKTQKGDGTETAWSDLVADFPDTWTSDHKVKGIAHSLLRFTSPGTESSRFGELLQGGVKDLELLGRWGRYYDQRNLAHDIDDPSTWSWTLNGVLIVQHFLRLLPGFSDALIDFDTNADTADEADELVATAAGTTPRCRLSGGWEGPLTHDIVIDMMESAGLEMRRQADGRWGLAFVEDDPESELTLTAEHILEISPLQVGPEGVKRPNIVRLTYFSPERRYELAEIGLHEQDDEGDYLAAGWSRIDSEIERYGEQEYPVQLTFQPDFARAQPIARRLFHMARAETATVRTSWAGMAAQGKRIISIEVPGIGSDGGSVFLKCRKGTMRIDDASGTCEIPIQVIPSELQTPWNPATMEAAAPPELDASQYAAELDTPAQPAGFALVQYSGGTYEVRIRTAGVPDAETVQATWRAYSAGLPGSWTNMTEVDFTLAYASAVVGNIGEAADFRIQFFGDDGAASNPSPVLSTSNLQIDNTAPAAPTVVSGRNYTSAELQIVKVEVERRIRNLSGGSFGSWTLFRTISNVRPDQTFDGASADTGTYFAEQHEVRISILTSNGTRGAYATYTINHVEEGGGGGP